MQKTVVGASVVCYINGKEYGQVESFSFRPDTPHKEARGIDSLEPFDLIPQAISISGQLGMYRTKLDGGAQGIGAATAFIDVVHAKFFTIQLRERVTQTVIFESRYSSVISENWEVKAKGIMTGQLAFRGLNWSNEMKNNAQG